MEGKAREVVVAAAAQELEVVVNKEDQMGNCLFI